MRICRRPSRDCLLLAAAIVLTGFLTVVSDVAQAQFSTPLEFSSTINVDKVDSTARTQLEQVKTYLADGQWDDAVETLREVMETHGSKLIPIASDRYLSVRNFCHLQLIHMPGEALALYRSRVDPQAKSLYAAAIASRDREGLLNVVEQLFASSWCDDALWALGEMSLEAGGASEARAFWQRLIRAPADAEETSVRLAVPDSQYSLADIRARLILASILEGSLDRAEGELARFKQLHADTRGRLAGRQVQYIPVLESLLADAQKWPLSEPNDSWPTFAGNGSRNMVLPKAVDIGALEWKQALEPPPVGELSTLRAYGFRPRRVAEDNNAPLSYHPLLIDNLVLVSGPNGIDAFHLDTGKPAFGQNPIYRDPDTAGGRRSGSRPFLGVPRYTMTVYRDRLYARFGSPISSPAGDQAFFGAPGYLVCLDLKNDGKVVWKIAPREEGWTFEGSPVVDGPNLYVGMRRSGVNPRAYVACYDASTRQQRWLKAICAADSPSHGQIDECTHNLLTLHGGTLYYNTNLGAVAALSARDGEIRWLRQYFRAGGSDLNRPVAHLYRDLNPCVYHQGVLYVAPTDSPRIFAFDAETGAILWETPYAEDAVHLLGVGGDHLFASGDRLYWINVAKQGRIDHVWPDGPTPRGFGRGLLVGDQVYWPTREEIHIFDQRTAQHEKVIPLSAQFPEATGGNLLVAKGYLFITTANQAKGHHLLAFSQYSRLRERLKEEITRVPEAAVPHFRLARCEESLGRPDEALALYRRAAALATPVDLIDAAPLPEAAGRRIYELLMRRGQTELSQSQWDQALEWFEAARQSATKPNDELASIMQAAEACVQGGRFDRAIDLWHSILTSDRLTSLQVPLSDEHDVQAAIWASERINQLLAQQLSLRLIANRPLVDVDLMAALVRTEPDDPRRPNAMLDEARFDGTGAPSRSVEISSQGSVLSLPLVRRWDKTHRGHMLVPEGHPASEELRCVLTFEAELRCWRLDDGRQAWRLNLDHPPYWAAHGPDGLLLATPTEGLSVDAANGRVLWRQPVRDPSPDQRTPHLAANEAAGALARALGKANTVAVTRPVTHRPAAPMRSASEPERYCARLSYDRRVLYVIADTASMRAIDAQRGKLLWRFGLSEGRLAGDIRSHDDWIALCATEPDRLIVLNSQSGAIRNEIRVAADAWSRTPLACGRDRLLVHSPGHQLHMFQLPEGSLLWTRRGSKSAHAFDWEVQAAGRSLVAGRPGAGLMGIDARDGSIVWERQPSEFDSFGRKPWTMAGIDSQAVYLATPNRLHAYRLSDGAAQWSRPLSAGPDAWRVARYGEYLSTYPSMVGDDGRLELVFLKPSDGRPVQRLTFHAPAGEARMEVSGPQALMATTSRVWLLK